MSRELLNSGGTLVLSRNIDKQKNPIIYSPFIPVSMTWIYDSAENKAIDDTLKYLKYLIDKNLENAELRYLYVSFLEFLNEEGKIKAGENS